MVETAYPIHFNPRSLRYDRCQDQSLECQNFNQGLDDLEKTLPHQMLVDSYIAERREKYARYYKEDGSFRWASMAWYPVDVVQGTLYGGRDVITTFVGGTVHSMTEFHSCLEENPYAYFYCAADQGWKGLKSLGQGAYSLGERMVSGEFFDPKAELETMGKNFSDFFTVGAAVVTMGKTATGIRTTINRFSHVEGAGGGAGGGVVVGMRPSALGLVLAEVGYPLMGTGAILMVGGGGSHDAPAQAPYASPAASHAPVRATNRCIEGFDGQNPIHTLFDEGAERLGSTGALNLKRKLSSLMDDVKKTTQDSHLTDQQKMEKAIQVAEAKGYRFNADRAAHNSPLDAINNQVLDCDASSHLLAMMAHELNIPYSFQIIPGHMYLKLGTREGRFFIDNDRVVSMPLVQGSSRPISLQGPTLEAYQLYAEFNRLYEGSRMLESGFFEPVLRAQRTKMLEMLDRVSALHPDYALYLYARGIVKRKLGDKAGAHADFVRARDLDPDLMLIKDSRGRVVQKAVDWDHLIEPAL